MDRWRREPLDDPGILRRRRRGHIARGIRIDSIATELTGDIDLQGVLDLDLQVRPGFQQITMKMDIKADCNDATLDELLAFVHAHSAGVRRRVPAGAGDAGARQDWLDDRQATGARDGSQHQARIHARHVRQLGQHLAVQPLEVGGVARDHAQYVIRLARQ